jgi:FAD/FMN-containing dehydrogenase
VSIFDEIVMSMERMNTILHFDPYSGIVSCEAGCILENVESYVADKGYTFPLDLGAKVREN